MSNISKEASLTVGDSGIMEGGRGGLMLEEVTLLKRQEKSSPGRESHTESINQI